MEIAVAGSRMAFNHLKRLGLILTGAIAWVAVGVLTKPPRTTLFALPAELLIQIAEDLPPESIALFSMTCRRLHSLLLPRKDRLLTESPEVNLRYIQLLLRDSWDGRQCRQIGCRVCLRILSFRNLRPGEPDIDACAHLFFRAPLYWGNPTELIEYPPVYTRLPVRDRP